MLQQRPIHEIIAQNNISDVLSEKQNIELERVFDRYLLERSSEFLNCTEGNVLQLVDELIVMIDTGEVVTSPLGRKRQDLQSVINEINAIVCNVDELCNLQISIGNTERNTTSTFLDLESRPTKNEYLIEGMDEVNVLFTGALSRNLDHYNALMDKQRSKYTLTRFKNNALSSIDRLSVLARIYLQLEIEEKNGLDLMYNYGNNQFTKEDILNEIELIISDGEYTLELFKFGLINKSKELIALTYDEGYQISQKTLIQYLLTDNSFEKSAMVILFSGCIDLNSIAVQDELIADEGYMRYISRHLDKAHRKIPTDFLLKSYMNMPSEYLGRLCSQTLFVNMMNSGRYDYTKKYALVEERFSRLTTRLDEQIYKQVLIDLDISPHDQQVFLETLYTFEVKIADIIAVDIKNLKSKYGLSDIVYDKNSKILGYEACSSISEVYEGIKNLKKELYQLPPPLLSGKKIILAQGTEKLWSYSGMNPNENTIILHVRSRNLLWHEMFHAFDRSDNIFVDDEITEKVMPKRVINSAHYSLVGRINEAQAILSERLMGGLSRNKDYLKVFKVLGVSVLPDIFFDNEKGRYILGPDILNKIQSYTLRMHTNEKKALIKVLQGTTRNEIALSTLSIDEQIIELLTINIMEMKVLEGYVGNIIETNELYNQLLFGALIDDRTKYGYEAGKQGSYYSKRLQSICSDKTRLIYFNALADGSFNGRKKSENGLREVILAE